MRRLSNRYLLNRFVSLSSALAAQQSSGGLETNHAVVENVRKIYSLSVSQAPRIGVEEVRGTIDLKDGYSRQQRWYARSNCEKARADGDDMATQMIKYAATSRNQDASHAEAVRVLEQGRSFLSGDGAASATATGRVLLTLATFYADRYLSGQPI